MLREAQTSPGQEQWRSQEWRMTFSSLVPLNSRYNSATPCGPHTHLVTPSQKEMFLAAYVAVHIEAAAANLPPSLRKLFARGGWSPDYLTSAALAIILKRGNWSGPLAADMKKPLRRGETLGLLPGPLGGPKMGEGVPITGELALPCDALES